MSGTQVAPAIVVAAGKTNDGTAYYEAKWRDRDDRQVKRRLGRAWVEPDGAGGWRKRRGRTPAGWLDERSVHITAAEADAAVEQQRVEKANAEGEAEKAAQLAAAATFRDVAHEWPVWKREAKGGAPSTLRDNEALLREEPGVPFKRGDVVSEGRIMKRFGDQPIETVTIREDSASSTDPACRRAT
jgi:hypothetical protein